MLHFYLLMQDIIQSIRAEAVTVDRNGIPEQYLNGVLSSWFPDADFGRLGYELAQSAEMFGLSWSKAAWSITNGGERPILSIAYTAWTVHGTIELERRILRDKQSVIACHDIFGIPDLLQNNDFSRIINRVLYKFYQRIGLDSIKMRAGLDAGGYVWAIAGFAATKRVELDKIIEDAHEKRLEPTSIISEDTLEFLEEDIETHFSSPDPGPFPIYQWILLPNRAEIKEILIGSTWHGELNFDDNVQIDTFEKYVNKNEYLLPW
jgi:hypothetical protein